MENQRLSIEQKRAKFAFERKESPKNDKGKSLSSNYDAMVKKASAYIQTNGFVYTMAFLEKKDEGVFRVVWEWNCSCDENILRLNTLKTINEKGFIKTLTTDLTDDQIRLVTIETLALLTWLRRFVKDDE